MADHDLRARVMAASYETYDHRRLVYRGDALAIVGKDTAMRDAIDALPCLGNHKVGYCAGVVVSEADVLAILAGKEPNP